MRAQLEPIASAAAASFHSRHVLESRFQHPLHYHPEIEITYILRSSGTRLVGDHVGHFNPGDLCVIGSNLPHQYVNTFIPPDDAEAEVLQFDRNFSGGFIDATPELLPLTRLLDRARLGLVFEGSVSVHAGGLLRSIRLASSFARMRLFMELMDCLICARSFRSLASPGYIGTCDLKDGERLQPACQHIIEHYNEELSHKTLAAKAHLAPASFSRLFKRVTGRTCVAFINEIRLGQACRLLQETTQPITRIAFDCGFSDLSNFNRRFRQRYGCSPREYRQQ